MPELELTSDDNSEDEAASTEAKVFKVAQKPPRDKSNKTVKTQKVVHTPCVNLSKQDPVQLPGYEHHAVCLDTGPTAGTAGSEAMQSTLTSTQKQDVTMHTADNGTATIDMLGFGTLYVLNTKS